MNVLLKSTCLIAFLGILSACHQVTNRDTVELDNKLLTLQLKETFDKKNEWLISDDRDSLKTLLFPQIQYGHSNCWIQDFSDMTMYESSDSLIYKSIEVDNLEVDVLDNVGTVRGVALFSGVYKGHEFDLDLCFTETYYYKNSRWRLLSRQSAKVPK